MPVDYAALAQKHGATPPPPDYAALAKKHGATPAPANEAAERPGFWSGFAEMIPNPVGLIREYINRPNEYGAALRGMTAALKERRGEVNPETQAAVEEGLAANVQLPGSGSDLVPSGTAVFPRVVGNIAEGNYAAAAGNVTALPAAALAVRAVPPLARGVGKAARTGVRAAQSPGALDMVGGAGEMVAGAGSALAGHPAIGTGLAVRGAAQFKKGLEARSAAKATAATPPTPAAAAGTVELTAHEQSLVGAVLDHPEIYHDLTKATRTRLIPELKQQGFTAFGKPQKAASASQPSPSRQEPAIQTNAAPVVQMPKPVNPTAVVTAEEAAAAGDLSLEEAMQRSLERVKAQKAGQQTPATITTIPHKPDEFAPALYETSARGAKAGRLSQLLHEHGIPYADAKRMTAEMWEQLAKAAGVKTPSLATKAQALFELNKLDKTTRQPASGSRASR